ncbi:MAG: dienelactone hydrolase family protein [Proteobacteria bacterium]|nr:MAG: dienelactone hydrolase family protein [Pseudomonadota bacterium]
MRIFQWLPLVISLGVMAPAQAKVITRTVEYKDGSVTLEGFLALPASGSGKAPGVLVVHEWMGLNPYVKKRAEMLAELGFVAFAADIYGKGVRPSTPEEAAKTAGIYKADRPLLRKRAALALAELRKQPQVDGAKVDAIGYCFGGATVLELARAGADLNGVVSFHGSLDTPTPADAKNIKAKVLVLHGADDPYVPAKDVAAFEDEMRAGGTDWQLVKYSNAVHSFTDKGAGNDNTKGAAYNASADRRSWDAMRAFFRETLGR